MAASYSRSAAARSAALPSMQNSLPAGSAKTTQPLPFGFRLSSTMVAPSADTRSTSSSRGRSGSRSRCTRFFSDFFSGTRTNNSVG
ncbi:hypothetical protein SLUN_36705 [Streptomyces lunaelactis]|uniref:Uncharacterized protein n=1 Tax=Streptomyces lunaelactis TaxID=1535768 RepID=A0A2R4TCQ5_9ACTN|nr:hypothetical protein SLUN_36705 [Streptomyces lunaelactis]